MPKMDAGGVEFELEKNWILAHAATLRVKRDREVAKKLADEAEWAAGGGVECGCCFDDFLPVGILQHLLSTQLNYRETCSNVETGISFVKSAVFDIPKQSSVTRST
jgi:hypothetical protein